jgi:hypothetical protein
MIPGLSKAHATRHHGLSFVRWHTGALVCAATASHEIEPIQNYEVFRWSAVRRPLPRVTRTFPQGIQNGEEMHTHPLGFEVRCSYLSESNLLKSPAARRPDEPRGIAQAWKQDALANGFEALESHDRIDKHAIEKHEPGAVRRLARPTDGQRAGRARAAPSGARRAVPIYTANGSYVSVRASDSIGCGVPSITSWNLYGS